MTVLLFAGVALIAVLVAILAYTLLRLRAQRVEQARTAQVLAAHNQRAHEERIKSLEMITLATLAGDCELSEGCLRVWALLADYPGLRADPAHAAIAALYQEISDFAVGEARRSLGEDELKLQDRTRLEVEGRHRAAVLESFGTLREQAVALQGSAYDVDLALGAAPLSRAA